MKKFLLALSIAAFGVGCTRTVPVEYSTAEGVLDLVVGVSGGSASKAELNATTGAVGVQFLKLDGAAAPSDFSLATVFPGDVAPTTGKVTFTTVAPTYNLDNTHAWLVAYCPAGTVTGGVVEWPIDGSTDILRTEAVWDAGNYVAPLTGATDPKLILKHCLSQVAVIFQAEGGASLDAVRMSWGEIKQVEFLGSPTTMRYSLSDLLVHNGGTLVDFSLLKDYNGTPFGALEVPVSGNAAIDACAMLAPVVATATESFRLRVTTQGATADVGDDIVVELPISLNNTLESMVKGHQHRVTLTFKAGGRDIVVDQSVIEPWTDGSPASSDVELPKPLVNPPAASDIVTINGLQWTKGNLVAKNTNECQVGAPTDYGVYFQFGSLVGWTGGNVTNGNGTGQGSPATVDKAVWPLAMGTSKPSYAWPSKNAAGTSTLADYYFNYSVAPWATDGQNIRDFAVAIDGDSGSGTLADGRYAKLGVGDPCTYYLGAPWRLPTTTELASITGKTGSSNIAWTTSGLTGRWVTSSEPFDGVSGPGGWFGSPLSAGSGTPSSSVNPFFPASGYRNPSDGSFNYVTTLGYYWSSSVYRATYGYNLYFNQSNGVIPQDYNYRSGGFPVRCVSGTYVPPPPTNPPAASDIVTISGLKWTKGNLVAKNSNECKVGAPTAYGVYFQFGSLVGWTGGTGNGTGQGSPALDKAVWPSAMGTSKPSYAWPSKDIANTSTLSNYYFNYSAAPWATDGQNIREFAVAIDGDSGSGTLASGRYAALGVGDPCTYYLGAPWRLPTTTELASITGKTGTSSITWTASGVTGRWVTSSEPFDGVSGPGGWFGSPLSAGTGTPKVSVNLFFPASGYRHGFNGPLNDVTTAGFGWSSSVLGATVGWSLYFTSSLGYPQYNRSRSYGFPVRCVSSVP